MCRSEMISIVIPCYNCEKTIERAIKSIANQNHYVNWEMILIDDGSTDQTERICDYYSSIDKRIKSYHQNNQGLMRSWKNGVEYANGDYISFCDSDDYYEDGFLDHVSEKIRKYGPDVFAFGIVMDYENDSSIVKKNSYEGFFDRDSIEREIIPNLIPDRYEGTWTILKSRVAKVYTKDLIEEIIPLLPDHVSQGEDNLTTLAAVMKAQSMYVDRDYTPYHYVRNDQSMIGRYDEKWFKKLILLHDELKELAIKTNYRFYSCIDMNFFYNTLLYLKKEFSRSDKTYNELIEDSKSVRDSEAFTECLKGIDISKLTIPYRIFARLFVSKRYILLVFITKTMVKLGVGKP